MISLEQQLADYGQLQDELFGPISIDEISSPIVPPGTVGVGNRPPQTRLGRGIGWAVAAFVVVVLAVGGMYYGFRGNDGQVVDQTTVLTSTTILAPEPESPVSGSMWPQSNLEEVREAQERADAGDADYTWQL
ncbi:MAG TPA: hypothetical protein VFV13_07090, partial [Acidimicrobiia bacterium]|nr:hypothetical protein [Acidimicrobiia bacterium]